MRASVSRRLVTGLVAGLLSLSLAPAAGAATAPYHVVVTGLQSPRGLDFGPGGILYAAEAGDADHASSVIRIRNPFSQNATVQPIASGLTSIGEEGEFLGVDGISVLGRGTNQSIYGIVGANPQATGLDGMGALLRIDDKGGVHTVANVGAFMYDWTADHSDLWEEFPDSNPYGVLAVPGHVYVTDAGANTLDEVHPDGSIDVLAYFPNTLLRDAIPTCVARGPDGSLYVGTLVLVESAFIAPMAKVYRLDPADANLADPTRTPMTEFATGLWPINGCTIANGAFYASQMFTGARGFPDVFGDARGDVVKIPLSDGSAHTFLADGSLGLVGGVAVAPDGTVFAADGTAFAPDGRIVRLTRH